MSFSENKFYLALSSYKPSSTAINRMFSLASQSFFLYLGMSSYTVSNVRQFRYLFWSYQVGYHSRPNQIQNSLCLYFNLVVVRFFFTLFAPIKLHLLVGIITLDFFPFFIKVINVLVLNSLKNVHIFITSDSLLGNISQ